MNDSAIILIVDDSLLRLKNLQFILEQNAYKVLTASDAHDALTLLKKQINLPDLIITDVTIPNVNGLELCKTVKKIYPKIPVIILTEHGNYDNMQKAFEYGVTDYITDPSSKIEVLKRISNSLEFRKIEEKYLKLIQNVPDALYTALPNKTGTILFISDKWKDWTGYSPEDCYKNPEAWPKSIHPDDREQAIKTYTAAIAGKEENFSEYRLVNKNTGQVRWVYDHGTPSVDSNGNIINYYGTVTDITIRKKMEGAIADEQAFTNTIIQSIPDLFYTFNINNSKFIRRNNNWTAITGYTDHELNNLTMLDMIAEKERCSQCIRHVLEQGQSSMEGTLITKDKREIPYFFTGTRVIIGDNTYVVGVGIDISERKKAEKALQENESSLRTTLNSLGDAVIATDIYGKITSMNPVAVELTGWTFNETQNVDFSKVFSIIDNKRRTSIESQIPLVINKRKTFEIKDHTILISKEGNEYQITGSIAPIIDDNNNISGTVLVFSNITEIFMIKEALKQRLIALTYPIDDIKGIAFETLFDLEEIQILQDQFSYATGVASIITDPNGKPITKPSNFSRLCSDFIRTNKKGSLNCEKSDKLLGIPSSEGPTVHPCYSCGLWDAGASISVGGKHIATWLIGQVRNEYQKEDEILRYADKIGIADKSEFLKAYREVKIMSKEQFYKIAEALYTNANQLSKIAYQNIQQARFISEKQKAEEALQKQSTELIRSNKALEQFAYAASHDLQEPMRIISSSIEIIKKYEKDKLSPKSQKFFNFAADASNHMRLLIKALLEVSMIRGKEKEFSHISLNYLLDKLLKDLRGYLNKTNTKIILPNTFPAVYGNHELIRTLFKNIILNGIKYNENKEPLITVSWNDINDKDYIEFCIKDNGIGIEEKDNERIFKIFKRLHSREKYPGSGIGLALCKNIVELHDGAIWLKSTPGVGSNFYFTLKKVHLTL